MTLLEAAENLPHRADEPPVRASASSTRRSCTSCGAMRSDELRRRPPPDEDRAVLADVSVATAARGRADCTYHRGAELNGVATLQRVWGRTE